MAYSYDVTTNIGKLRALIPDNNSEDYTFEDEDLQVFLDMYSSNLTLARIQVYYTLAANAMAQNDGTIQIGATKIDEDTQKGRKYLELAQKLEQAYLSGQTLELIPHMFATGISQLESDQNKKSQLDGTIVKKAFTDDMYKTQDYTSMDEYLSRD